MSSVLQTWVLGHQSLGEPRGPRAPPSLEGKITDTATGARDRDSGRECIGWCQVCQTLLRAAGRVISASPQTHERTGPRLALFHGCEAGPAGVKPTPPVPLCSEAQAGPSGVPDTRMNWETQASVLRFCFYSFLQPVECRNVCLLSRPWSQRGGSLGATLWRGPQLQPLRSSALHPLGVLAGEFHGLCSPRVTKSRTRLSGFHLLFTSPSVHLVAPS